MSAGVSFGERSFGLGEAEARGREALALLGLGAELDSCGSGDPTAWRCTLTADGAPVPSGVGLGKGDSRAARTGALYEALEHFLTQEEDFDPLTTVLRSVEEVCASEIGDDACAPLLREQPGRMLACREYASLIGGAPLAVPLFLSNTWWVEDAAKGKRREAGDNFDYTAVCRYSTNNGSAIGGSYEEAAVHAVNEAIERDALSMFMANAYLNPSPDPIRILDREGLPENLTATLHAVEEQTGRDVVLIDMTTDIGVPTTLAYAAGPHGQYLRGCGTSLSRTHSAQRALTELLQGHLAGTTHIDVRMKGLAKLDGHPALQRCAALDLDQATAPRAQVPFRDTRAPSTPALHLREIGTRLAIRGFTAHTAVTHTLPNGVTTVHTHVPRLERFLHISDGFP
ncbi:YcaO-like family protein [Streptomyces erythrochromogenes]|uniref:YcaO-like family protein n=1 Tax=Streptomyces erythrochromogenes TaxID=285574 RepID=UPI00341AD0A9